jgi:hypothetical protein
MTLPAPPSMLDVLRRVVQEVNGAVDFYEASTSS